MNAFFIRKRQLQEREKEVRAHMRGHRVSYLTALLWILDRSAEPAEEPMRFWRLY